MFTSVILQRADCARDSPNTRLILRKPDYKRTSSDGNLLVFRWRFVLCQEVERNFYRKGSFCPTSIKLTFSSDIYALVINKCLICFYKGILVTKAAGICELVNKIRIITIVIAGLKKRQWSRPNGSLLLKGTWKSGNNLWLVCPLSKWNFPILLFGRHFKLQFGLTSCFLLCQINIILFSKILFYYNNYYYFCISCIGLNSKFFLYFRSQKI